MSGFLGPAGPRRHSGVSREEHWVHLSSGLVLACLMDLGPEDFLDFFVEDAEGGDDDLDLVCFLTTLESLIFAGLTKGEETVDSSDESTLMVVVDELTTLTSMFNKALAAASSSSLLASSLN
ncbi:hypothetical protein WICPIJ_009751 [Wickerhamomyces pijperi]|uniref:Uncharacterized protein n=1 Tax=Wickerhamomyces pijperi TaxID=599730 RepID=A0A9P8PJU3_WICPI|nr:hypothetical protein WICPIJ_009751 [Wickerhamomyces pijperi]